VRSEEGEVRSGLKFSFWTSHRGIERLEFNVVKRLIRDFEWCDQKLFIERKN